MVITVSHSGYIKRIGTDAYKTQGRGGKGISATGLKDEDSAKLAFQDAVEIDPKIQILVALEDFSAGAQHEKIRAAVEPFLEDVNEPARFHAAATLLAQNDPGVIGPLLLAREVVHPGAGAVIVAAAERGVERGLGRREPALHLDDLLFGDV